MKKQFWGLDKDIILYGVTSGVLQAIGTTLLPFFTRVFSVGKFVRTFNREAL